MISMEDLELEVSVDEDPDRLRRLLDVIGFEELLAPASEEAGVG